MRAEKELRLHTLSRVAPRLLHEESYVHGVWIGEIEGASRTIAVEQYKQTLSSLSIRGRAFWPDGTKAAEWRSSLAAIDPEGPRILAMFRSTIFNDAGHVVRDTRGFGELELDGDRITGVVIDRPEIRADGQAIPKIFHYRLERSRCKDLGEAESSDQFKCLLQQHGRAAGGAG